MLQIHPFNKVHETPPVGRAQVSSQGHRSEPHEACVVGSQARGRKPPESHKGGTKTDGLSAGGEKELLAHGRAPPGATARHTCPGLLQGASHSPPETQAPRPGRNEIRFTFWDTLLSLRVWSTIFQGRASEQRSFPKAAPGETWSEGQGTRAAHRGLSPPPMRHP